MRRQRGSSLVYVITLVVMLGMVSTSFLYLLEFNIKTTTKNREQLQHYYLAKSVHRSVCEAAQTGELEVLNDIVEASEADRAAADTDINTASETAPDPFISEYHVSTGRTYLELSDQTQAEVTIDLAYFENTEEGRQVRIETFVRFTDEDFYRYGVLLGQEAGLAGTINSRESSWVVLRHFEGSEDEDDE